MNRITAVLTALVLTASAVHAGDTIVPPQKVDCNQAFHSTTEQAALNLMWIAGFASSANRGQKPHIDWLKGRTVSDVVNLVEELCKADPKQTVEEVAIAVVGRWRMEWAGKQIYDEEQRQKKKR